MSKTDNMKININNDCSLWESCYNGHSDVVEWLYNL